MCLDERFEGGHDVGIDGAGGPQGRLYEGINTKEQQLFVCADHFFADGYFWVRDLVFADRERLLAPVGLLKIFALERTGEGDLAFRAAANCADIAVHGGTSSSSAPLTADFAQDGFEHRPTAIIGSAPMKRVDLYIKVTVDLEDEEKPERVAGEICRQVEKLYVVRAAELSSAVAKDE